MKPQLKRSVGVTLDAASRGVLVYHRAHERLQLDDDDGSVALLLELLAEGTRTIAQLSAAMGAHGRSVSDTQMDCLVESLDNLGLLKDADAETVDHEGQPSRHTSNLLYYEMFTSLSRSSPAIHSRATNATVLLLGVGGVGCGVLQALVGAGVGTVRIVDMDHVETKNLARQFCFGQASLGLRKVDAAAAWVTAYSPETHVEVHHEAIGDVHRIRQLAQGCQVVVCAIDSPADAQLLVNDACFDLGVPFVSGGLQQSTAFYWSVEPGISPCRRCLELHRDDGLATRDSALRDPALVRINRANRGTGPVVQLLSGLMSLEVLRYVGRHDPPVAAAKYQWIALADGMAAGADPWTRHPACHSCQQRPTPVSPSDATDFAHA